MGIRQYRALNLQHFESCGVSVRMPTYADYAASLDPEQAAAGSFGASRAFGVSSEGSYKGSFKGSFKGFLYFKGSYRVEGLRV